VPEKAAQGENYCLFQDTAVTIKLNKNASESEMKWTRDENEKWGEKYKSQVKITYPSTRWRED
jgi:hypothetical protein